MQYYQQITSARNRNEPRVTAAKYFSHAAPRGAIRRTTPGIRVETTGRGKKTHANARHVVIRTGTSSRRRLFRGKKYPCFRGSRSVSPELVRFAMIVLSISHSGGVPYAVRKHVPTPDLTTLYLITARRSHSEDRDKQRDALRSHRKCRPRIFA